MPSEPISTPLQIEGIQPIIEALRSGQSVSKVWVSRDAARRKEIQELLDLTRSHGIPFSIVHPKDILRIAQTKNPQGVMAWIALAKFSAFDDFVDRAGRKPDPIFLAIDHIEDPHNLGAILRSAEGIGVSGVILPKHRIAPLSATTSKASAGALAHLKIARVANIKNALQELQKASVKIIGADMNGTTNYDACDVAGPLAFVIGSEHEGLSRLVRETCDVLVKIPMRGKVDSLNASVAAGIILFDIMRRKGVSDA